MISLHANPINIDEDSSSNWVNNNSNTDTLVQNNRGEGSHNADVDQGSAVPETPQKDTYSSKGELIINRNRHGPKVNDEPPLKMSRQILHQVDDDLGIQEAECRAVNELLAEKIDHTYFETSQIILN